MNSLAPKMMNLLLLLVMLLGKKSLATSDYSYSDCEGIVKSWADKSLLELEGRTEQKNFELKDFLFFLHVPRTGGRNYYSCFLRKLFSKDQKCPQSYEKLRFDLSEPGCSLMVSHDDYSLMSMMPSERTSVLTIMRNPVDRVLSIYEFSIEVAARFLIHPNSSSMRRNQQYFTNKGGLNTLNIWPWKYLVPWMRKDLFGRRDARDLGRMAMQGYVDYYNFPAMAMPLHEYIHQPLAYDIIHNGGTFQVAGLTSNSYLDEAQEIRQCVLTYPFLGKHVLEVAKRRLDQMLYVGLTESHKDSATILANIFGTEMLSHLHSSNFSFGSYHAASNKTGLSKETSQVQITVEDRKSNIDSAIENAKEQKGNFTVSSLLESYEKCAFSIRSRQSERRISSLKSIAPINFTEEERTLIPESTIKEIVRLNSLDVELFKHARNIFSQQQRALNQQKTFSLHKSSSQEDNFNNAKASCQSPSRFWPFVLFAPLVAVFIILAARRRSSKIKL